MGNSGYLTEKQNLDLQLKRVVQEVPMLHNTHFEKNSFEVSTSSTRHIL